MMNKKELNHLKQTLEVLQNVQKSLKPLLDSSKLAFDKIPKMENGQEQEIVADAKSMIDCIKKGKIEEALQIQGKYASSGHK